jgi:nucleotidyltransferase substrate binding protein (TIGR01987 family)
MIKTSLDFSSLNKAINSLERAIIRSKSYPDDEELRDAVIQRFEYTYELCWKMLKKQLEIEAANPAAIDSLSFPDLLREAAEKGIIEDVSSWLVYREHRNITSHTYDELKANKVKQTAFQFIIDAKRLLSKLEQR